MNILKKIKIYGSIVIITATILQILFFPTIANIFSAILLNCSWGLLCLIVIKKYTLYNYPISFIMVLGVSIFHYLLPAPLTLIEGKPITFNLNEPIETLLHHFLFSIIIIASHLTYQVITKSRVTILRHALMKLNFYYSPSDAAIWILGLISFGSSTYFYISYGAWENYGEKNIIATLLNTTNIFIYAPFIIPFRHLRNTQNNISKSHYLFILIYAISLIILSVISNWRTMLYSGILTVSLLALLNFLLGYSDIRKYYKPKNLLIFFLVFYVVVGPLGDLGIAMLANRGNRYSSDPIEFLHTTFTTLNDERVLEAVKGSFKDKKVNVQKSSWDESYLSNSFLNRFCNLKISDNCIYFSEKLGHSNTFFRDIVSEQIVQFVPKAILDFLGVSTTYEKIPSSTGDFLYTLSTNNPSLKGRMILSSMPGIGLALFGYWYPIVFVLILVILFYLFDSLALVNGNRIHFSFFFLLKILFFFNYFNDRHVFISDLRIIARTHWESIFFFLIYIAIARYISKIFKSKHSSYETQRLSSKSG